MLKEVRQPPKYGPYVKVINILHVCFGNLDHS